MAWVLPLIKELVENKIIPAIIKRSYEAFDKKANDVIENLNDLLEKIKSTDDPEKRNRHLQGFKLGIAIIEAVGNKLTQAAKLLNKEVAHPLLMVVVAPQCEFLFQEGFIGVALPVEENLPRNVLLGGGFEEKHRQRRAGSQQGSQDAGGDFDALPHKARPLIRFQRAGC